MNRISIRVFSSQHLNHYYVRMQIILILRLQISLRIPLDGRIGSETLTSPFLKGDWLSRCLGKTYGLVHVIFNSQRQPSGSYPPVLFSNLER